MLYKTSYICIINLVNNVRLGGEGRTLINVIRGDTHMYGGGVVLGAATTVAGAIVLPNTGNKTLAIAATLSIAIGVFVLATTAIRFVAKKAYGSN